MLVNRPLLRLGCYLAVLLTLAGCGAESPDSADSAGSLSLDLVLGNGAQIDEVRWGILRAGMTPMLGTIDTSAPGATASVEVFGLPPGEDYLLLLVASSTDESTTCEGSMLFDVSIGEVTELHVLLQCQTAPDRGAVRVETSINFCGELIKVVVSPLTTSVGNDIDLSAIAEDPEGNPVSYLWTGSGGTIANPTFPETTYTCQQVGQQFVTIQVSDAERCTDEWTVPVTCVDGNGGGGGACTNVADFEVYDGLSYSNDDGSFVGTQAADELSLDCIFGTAPNLTSDGCGAEAGRVLGDNSPQNRAALATCVEVCMVQQPVDLTSECLECYGVQSTCEVAFCAARCVGGRDLPSCIACRCENGCPQDFDSCSGLPNGNQCNNGGTGGAGGTGGTGGTAGGVGGTGGTGDGNCTNADDLEVYNNLSYSNDDGSFVGTQAASEVSLDCIFGTAPNLTSIGCGTEVGTVLGNNSPQNRAALATCIEVCMVQQPVDLTSECLECYGDRSACELAFCAPDCIGGRDLPNCIACRCENGCPQDFDSCSGLPNGTQCNGGGTGGAGGTGGGAGGNGGGNGDGTCTNAADFETYDNLSYSNDDGSFVGTQAADEISLDCVFGTAPNLTSRGCGAELGAVLGNNNAETRAALATCVEVCMIDQPVDLTIGCLGCYGERTTCELALCAPACVAGQDSPGCIACLCENGCFQGFDACSGLPSGGQCDDVCDDTCGIGNETPDWDSDLRVLECSVMGIGIGLEVAFQAQPSAPVVVGAQNTYDLSAEVIIPADVVNLITALADSFELDGFTATVEPALGSTDTHTVPLILKGTPCTVCLERDVADEVQLPQTQGAWTLDEGNEQVLLVDGPTILINAAGLTLVLSTIGDDPACIWEDQTPPSLTFGAPLP